MLSLMLAAGDAPMDPLGHVLDKDILGTGPFALTMNTLALILAGIATIILTTFAARAIATGPETDGNRRYVTKGRFSQIFEVIVVYLRDDVIRPQLGDEWRKWTPFLLTTFFFILTCNLLGLVPLIDLQYLLGKVLVQFGVLEEYSSAKFIGGTPTGRWTTTLALACVAFFAWTAHGISSMGLKGFFGHFTGGVPASMWPLWFIMVPVEIIGTFVKPAALTIRLFANMTAGHILLAALIGLVGLSLVLLTGALGSVAGLGLTLVIAIVMTAVAVAIFFLELFVALLQAYIFMFLTTMFIAQMSHHHGHEHDEEHEREAEIEHTPEILGHPRGA